MALANDEMLIVGRFVFEKWLAVAFQCVEAFVGFLGSAFFFKKKKTSFRVADNDHN